LVLAGMNKVAGNLESAIDRARNVAAPINCVRLNRQTPCLTTGLCGDCHSDDCICSNIVITRHNPLPGRIKVILIGEDCGY
ncbi:MAG: LUD domain-containing protein, partial [Eubacterium sp.]